MGTIGLTIYGQSVQIAGAEVPKFTAETVEFMKDKCAGLVVGDHHKKVEDLSASLANRELAQKNQTKAKILCVLITAAAVASLAVGAFFAISGCMAATVGVTTMKFMAGFLGSAICMSLNRVCIFKLLGFKIPRPETIFEAFKTMFLPIQLAFKARSVLEKDITAKTLEIQTIFESSIRAYQANLGSSMEALQKGVEEKKTTVQENNRQFAILMQAPEKMLEALDLANRTADILKEIGASLKAVGEIQAMNLFLQKLPAISAQ